ncbi:MAG: DUF4147 domain-containing protein, partial [Paracoccaceae bacterium]
MTPLQQQAVDAWSAGVAAVDGYAATQAALQRSPSSPVKILAVGKAAAAMTQAALEHCGEVPTLVVTKDGHAEGLPNHVEVIEAAHPVPDARSVAGGQALRKAVMELPEQGELLLLVSGGASALAEDPVPGKTLDNLTALNREMLAQGLDIRAMNRKRRKLSRIKGGRLLDHRISGSVRVLAISDVPDDDIGVIGSGIGAALPERRFAYQSEIVASNQHARDTAAAAATAAGFTLLGNDESLHDDLFALAARIGAQLRDMPRGAMILGGEPTVVLPENPGRGGRNQGLALALAREIAGIPDLAVVVGGTDGSDGPTDAAGGLIEGTTWQERGADAPGRADRGNRPKAHGSLLTTRHTGAKREDLRFAFRAL